MDHAWAAGQLRGFVLKIDQLVDHDAQDWFTKTAAPEGGVSAGAARSVQPAGAMDR
jgi:hypothetical protein